MPDTHSSYHADIQVPANATAARHALFHELTKWWSLRVDPLSNGFRIHFGGSHVRFDYAGEDQMIWRVVESNMLIDDVPDADEWLGTHLEWQIADHPGGCKITLTHHGLSPQLACYDVCSRGWQHYFETSLRAHLSGGTPAPETR